MIETHLHPFNASRLRNVLGAMRRRYPNNPDRILNATGAMFDLYERVTRFFVDEPMLAGLLKSVLAQPSSAAVSEWFAEYMGRVRDYYRAALEQGLRLGAVRDDLPIELLVQVSFAIGEALDRWTLERWELLTAADFERISREMLAMHMRAIAPLSLAIESELRGKTLPQTEVPR